MHRLAVAYLDTALAQVAVARVLEGQASVQKPAQVMEEGQATAQQPTQVMDLLLHHCCHKGRKLLRRLHQLSMIIKNGKLTLPPSAQLPLLTSGL